MNYVIASSAREALDQLVLTDGKGIILAGGTDLMVDLGAGKIKMETAIHVAIHGTEDIWRRSWEQ